MVFCRKFLGQKEKYNIFHRAEKCNNCFQKSYINDERFTKNIDQNGKGTAQFMSKAIDYYCKGVS